MHHSYRIATETWKSTDLSVLFCVSMAIALLFFINACTSDSEIDIPEEIAAIDNVAIFSANSEPLYQINLNPAGIFGDTDEVLLGSWLTSVTDLQGRVFVADLMNDVIHAYLQNGDYIGTVGRTGEGPGEYRQISQIRTCDTWLHLFDSSLSRITRYNLETFETDGMISIDVDQDQTGGHFRMPRSFFIADDANYLIQFTMAFSQANPEADDEARRIEGRLLNSVTGEYMSGTIFSFRAPDMLVNRQGGGLTVLGVPYKRNSVISYQGNQMIHGRAEHFLFTIYDESGQYKRAVYYPFDPVRLSREQVLAEYADSPETIQNMVSRDTLPEHWPAFETFIVDDEGRIWVKMFTGDLQQSNYKVLDNSGELLAQFTWPRQSYIQQIQNGFLYTMEEDEDGLRHIAKYEIELI